MSAYLMVCATPDPEEGRSVDVPSLGTFIMPTGARKPSLLQQPSKRLGLEWQRVKTRCKDLYS